jgi:hypothetical protein
MFIEKINDGSSLLRSAEFCINISCNSTAGLASRFAAAVVRTPDVLFLEGKLWRDCTSQHFSLRLGVRLPASKLRIRIL